MDMGKKWSVGEYGWRRWSDSSGVLIRVDGVSPDGSITGGQFISRREDGSVYPGGSWGGGDNSNVVPLTDPEHILAVRLFEADRRSNEHRAALKALEVETQAIRIAISAVREAVANQKEPA